MYKMQKCKIDIMTIVYSATLSVNNFLHYTVTWFLARNSMLSALYAIANSFVRLSVRPSVVTRVDQSKTVEARIVQFSPYHPSSFCRISFIQKFERDPPERGRQTRVGNLTVVAWVKYNTWRLHSLDGAVIVWHGVCPYFLLILLNSLDLRNCYIILQ